MITDNLSTLKIHKLTQAQYDRESEVGNLDATALYLTPDEAAHPLIINGASYDGSKAVDITDIINTMIDAKIATILASQ